MGLSNILSKYRETAHDTRDQGDKFERLMKAYLLTEPQYRGLFKEVWLWNEFPSRKDFGGKDIGIDIVAKTALGDYWAVQCKFFKETTSISKPMVDTFLSTSGRSFSDTEEFGRTVWFSHRLWIDTTVHGFNTEAENAVKSQKIAVSRLSLYNLMDASVDWDKLEEGLSGNHAVQKKFPPRNHQIKAITLSHDYFQSHDRGKLIMACGTGKTFTSLKIAEKETEQTNGIVLFLVPSIALLGQTLKEWSAQAKNPLHPICICSDPQVSKSNSDRDDLQISTVDLALPASTDFKEISSQYLGATLMQKKDNGMIAVFSTYQSIDVISRTQKTFIAEGKSFVFDLIICDEAHRTTGVTLDGQKDSAFIKVHDDNFIKAKKRLYMTATPRLYSEESQKKAKEKDAYLCSMDDPSLYGEEIYRIGFGEAVENQLLSDYKVIVLTLDEDQMTAELQDAISNEGTEIPTDDALKLIGCINALSKKAKDNSLFSDIDPSPMHSAVAFCQTIKKSKQAVEAMNACRDAYYNILDENERTGIVSVEADHVDGTMGASIRDEKLSKLKNVSRENNDCRMLMNVRCLSEGVDVPSLDAILFLSAKNSQIDVVQSVGRVMRRAEGKKYGYIIIPVVIPSNIEPEDALDDNDRFKVVWTVLNALRAHDDRFNAVVNKLELNKRKPTQIIVTGTDIGGKASDSDSQGTEDAISKGIATQMEFQFEKLQSAVYAKLVEKCGDRRYWEQWAADVAKIAERHIFQIKRLVSVEGSKPHTEFARYLKGLRKNINPSVSEDDAIEMLAQHFITQPVFEALFKNYSFVQNNPMSKSMQGMVSILNEQTPKEDNEKLQRFYDSVRVRASNLDNAEAKQRVIVELYDNFFKKAFPRTVEKLGIVYTPVEIVDFILQSVEDILVKEFGRSMSDENVHILDPFTGTGTFITRLIQSNIINPKDLLRKYTKEIHANEIVLLAYYIASINIENVFHDIFNENITSEEGENSYRSFNGICLTDTFQLGEDDQVLVNEVFPTNSKRVNDLKETPLTVIIGNPPYSVGQNSANDNAQNIKYTKLELKIADTYAKQSNTSSTKSLHDSYIKAFRWSTDRLVKETGGVIGFVTNNSWIDKPAAEGFRKSIENEFSSIYVFDLRGAIRGKTGETAKKEGKGVFNIMTGVAITILVKNPNSNNKKAKIYYYSVEDYLSKEEKLLNLKQFKSLANKKIKNIIIQPNDHGDWLFLRNKKFEDFFLINPIKKFDSSAKSFFTTYSLGVNSNRDSWVCNYSEVSLENNIHKLIRTYNNEIEKLNISEQKGTKYIKCLDKSLIDWSSSLESYLNRKITASYNEDAIVMTFYRPFCKQVMYYDQIFIHRPGKFSQLFPPESDNLMICVSGVGSRREFSCLIINGIPSLDFLEKTQCFPLYYFKKTDSHQGLLFDKIIDEYVRHDGITDFILRHAKEVYGPRVTKEDIFYYVYGILHSNSFRKTFASDLKKMLPRLPLISEPKKFWLFSKAGNRLADLHINYELVEPSQEVIVTGVETGNFKVQKMRFYSKDRKDQIIYNNSITISNIPLKAYEYILNGKSAIESIMERYQMNVNKDNQIKNDPNDWAREHNQPRYILDLLLSIINVSVQTIDIVNSLPEVDWEKE
jgi:predicted helicase